ncbi:MAG: heme-copper oxidase subunit III [Ferruginibacter sp.]|nr:heme-copper oxidase subunit III [Ferruginibacter sp.]
MMFAGLTSAYIVKRNQANWQTFNLPVAFWYSTAIVLASSFTIMLALRSFKERAMSKYRALMVATMLLGAMFVILQIVGFQQLWQKGITLQGNVSYSFLYVIVGLHALHVVGGVIALVVMSSMAFSRKKRNYSIVPVELMSTYWHFVDILWIYLLIFLIMIK